MSKDGVGLVVYPDALDDLDRLEKCQRVTKLVVRQDSVDRQQDAALKLTEDMQDLTKKRDNKQENLTEVVFSGVSKPTENSTELLEAQQELAKLQALLVLYKLTGVSVKVLSSTGVLICFDSMYNGRYYEPYYVELKLGNRPSITHHSLPNFIPMGILEETLEKSIDAFCHITRSYIQAFVSRRESVKEVYEVYGNYLKGRQVVPSSGIISLTLINIPWQSGTVYVTLKYTNPLSVLPSKVVIECEGEVTSDEEVAAVKKCHEILKENYLQDAIGLIVSHGVDEDTK